MRFDCFPNNRISKRMNSLFRFLTICLVCSAAWIMPWSASAQEQMASVQFVAFPLSSDPQPVELLVGEGKTMEVELPSNSLSLSYKVPATANWILGKTVEGPDGKPKFDIYGQTRASASDKQVILVIRKGKDNADGFDLVPFDSGSKGFGGGKYLFLNGAKVDIAGDAGGTKFALKPRNHTLIAPNPSEVREERKYLYITLFFRKGEEATPFYSSTWRFSEKARTMVFFYHDPHNDRLRTHTIRDYVF
jgi:hypothetical protein